MMVEKFTSEFKLEVYNSDMLEKEREIDRSGYYGEREELPKGVIPWWIAQQMQEEYLRTQPDEYHCARLINKSLRGKSRKIKLWGLKQLAVFDELYFVSINFNNETYQQGDLKQLKEIAIKYFQSLKCNYCYSLGVGEQTSRLHYHAITTQKPKRKEELFGHVDYKRVASSEEMDENLIKEYLRNYKYNFETEKFLFNNVGWFFLKVACYIAKNSYQASLVLNKQQRISYKENIKITKL